MSNFNLKDMEKIIIKRLKKYNIDSEIGVLIMEDIKKALVSAIKNKKIIRFKNIFVIEPYEKRVKSNLANVVNVIEKVTAWTVRISKNIKE